MNKYGGRHTRAPIQAVPSMTVVPRLCEILSWMPKVDRLFSLLATVFDLSLDAWRFICLSLQPRCTLAARESFASQTASSVSGAPCRASSNQGSCQVDPGGAEAKNTRCDQCTGGKLLVN